MWLPVAIVVLTCTQGCLYLSVLHFTLISMTGISTSLFSILLCLESISAVKRSGPGLYNILTQKWCILRRICCILCDSVATSFLNIATSGL